MVASFPATNLCPDTSPPHEAVSDGCVLADDHLLSRYPSMTTTSRTAEVNVGWRPANERGAIHTTARNLTEFHPTGVDRVLPPQMLVSVRRGQSLFPTFCFGVNINAAIVFLLTLVLPYVVSL